MGEIFEEGIWLVVVVDGREVHGLKHPRLVRHLRYLLLDYSRLQLLLFGLLDVGGLSLVILGVLVMYILEDSLSVIKCL